MEKVKKEPQVLIEIDNIRVMEYDDANVKVERFEDVINPKTKVKEGKWRFVGYSRSIRTALEMIINKELLVDKNAVSDLKTYVIEVRWANQKVLALLDGENE